MFSSSISISSRFSFWYFLIFSSSSLYLMAKILQAAIAACSGSRTVRGATPDVDSQCREYINTGEFISIRRAGNNWF